MVLIFAIPNVKLTVEVKDLAEASREFQRLRNEYGIGASDMRGDCGSVYAGCRLAGRVSYNGRVWNENNRLLMEAA